MLAEAAEGDGRPSQPTFSSVKTRRNFEEICLQVRREVAAGRLKPGDRLPAEREMALQFNVSRTAVREALRSLEVAGIVQCQKGVNGGSFIKKGETSIVTRAVSDMVFLGEISTEAVTEARILITNDALRLACERATEADLDAIGKDIDLSEELTRKAITRGGSATLPSSTADRPGNPQRCDGDVDRFPVGDRADAVGPPDQPAAK